MQRIVPFVDHEIGYRLLQQLLAHAAKGRLEIPAVVTTPENMDSWWPSVDELCRQANIPLYLYENSFSADFLDQQPDWFLLLSWKHIIPLRLIQRPKHGVLNLHYSLLPEFRGVYPVNWAIINGKRVTGFTYHFVNDNIDDGEIFMQAEVSIRPSDTARSLQLRIDDKVCTHFDALINRLLTHNLTTLAKAPSKTSNEKSEYYSRAKFEAVRRIDLTQQRSGADFFSLIRGLTFFENSNNAYVVDEESGKKIYFSLNVWEE